MIKVWLFRHHFLNCYCTTVSEYVVTEQLWDGCVFCWKLCQQAQVFRAFSSCHTIAFSPDMDFVKLVSFQLRLPVIQQHWAGEKLQAFFFFFCYDEKEKKVQYLNPPQFISCSSFHLHVSQPCYNSFLLWLLLPRSCSTAPGVSLIPTALHNLHRAELHGSQLTSVIWRHNRLFISVAEMASRCCFYDTYSAWVQSLSNWEGNLDMNGPVRDEMQKHGRTISCGGNSLF